MRRQLIITTLEEARIVAETYSVSLEEWFVVAQPIVEQLDFIES